MRVGQAIIRPTLVAASRTMYTNSLLWLQPVPRSWYHKHTLIYAGIEGEYEKNFHFNYYFIQYKLYIIFGLKL